MNDTAINSVSALTSFVQGSPWSVTWYGQILGANNELAAFDVNRQAQYQQYKKINGLILMVTTPLNHQQDETTKEFVVSGAAICYGFLIPNVGDTFIATVDNGRQAIFNVTKSEKATYMAGANYQIDYQLTSYADPVLVTNLDMKAVQVFQFVKSLLTTGQFPLLSASDYALYGGLDSLFADLTSVYFRDFFSVNRQTLIMPDQPTDTYDHFLTKNILDIVATDESVSVPNIRLPSVSGDRIMDNVTLWDALIRTNKSLLQTGAQRMGIVPTVNFRNYPNLTGIFYTGIDSIAYPIDPRTDVDADYGYVTAVSIGPFTEGGFRYQSIERALRDEDNDFFATHCQCVEGAGGAVQLPYIVPVTTDDYYVFTKGFYGVRNSQLASQLEVMTRAAISNQPIDRELLTAIGVAAFNWPNLERFYYIPVVLALIRISLRST